MSVLQTPFPVRRGPDWKTIIIAVVIALAASAIFVQVAPRFGVELPRVKGPKTYPPAEIPHGFVWPAVSDRAFIFFMYDHPQEGLVPLVRYGRLYSNTLHLYAMSWQGGETELVFHFYQTEVVNGTEVIVNEETITQTLNLAPKTVTQIDVELPVHHDLYKCDVYADGKLIFSFYHITHPLYMKVPKIYTFGSLLLDRLTYIIAACSTFALGVFLGSVTVRRVKAVPMSNPWQALVVLIAILGLIGVSAYFLVYLFGFTNVAWTFGPIVLLSWIFGIMVTRPPVKWLYLTRDVESDVPQKEFHSLPVVSKAGETVLVPSWSEFLRRRIRRVRFEGKRWSFKIVDSEDELVYFTDIAETPEELVIQVAPIHTWSLEEWRSGELEVKAILKSAEELERENRDMRVKLATARLEARREAVQYVLSVFRRGPKAAEAGAPAKVETPAEGGETGGEAEGGD